MWGEIKMCKKPGLVCLSDRLDRGRVQQRPSFGRQGADRPLAVSRLLETGNAVVSFTQSLPSTHSLPAGREGPTW